jgi:hypothetical protein
LLMLLAPLRREPFLVCRRRCIPLRGRRRGIDRAATTAATAAAAAADDDDDARRRLCIPLRRLPLRGRRPALPNTPTPGRHRRQRVGVTEVTLLLAHPDCLAPSSSASACARL